MLTNEEIEEIKNHLENSQNPLFFFDNDVDGLSSFLLLARAYTGKGVAIKSGELNESYLRKVSELNPDCVFILDKPLVSKEFIEKVREKNIPLVWIDHHKVEVFKEGVHYYNPSIEGRGNEPTTFMAYQIARKDIWLAMAGCISDNCLPEFRGEFEKQYKELWKAGIKTAFQALYETEIGHIARILDFSLKDTTTNVLKVIKFMLKASSPLEVNQEHEVFERFKQIESKYRKLIEKARKFAKNNLLYFQYAGDLSISSQLANELSYRFPGKIIAVAYLSGSRANISMRGKNVRALTSRAIEGFQNATGGGHDDATGAKINASDLPEFKKRIQELVG